MTLLFKYFIGLTGIIILISSCSSTNNYALLKTENDNLRYNLNESKQKSQKLDSIRVELEAEKLQRKKTEAVLAEFYMKYEGKMLPENLIINQTAHPVNATINKSKWDSLQLASTNLKNQNTELLKNIADQKKMTASMEEKHAIDIIEAKKIQHSKSKKKDEQQIQIEAQEKMLKEQQYQLNTLSLEMNSLRHDDSLKKNRIDSLNQVNTKMLNQIIQRDLNISALTYDLSVKQNAPVSTSKHDKSIYELKKELNLVSTENAYLLDQNKKLNSEIKKEKEEIKKMKSKLISLEAESKNLNVQHSQLKVDVYANPALELKLTETEKQLSKSMEEIEKMKSKLIFLETESKNIDVQRSQIKIDTVYANPALALKLKEAENEVSKSKVEIQQIQSLLSEKRNQEMLKQKQLDSTTKKHMELSKNYRQQIDSLNKVTAKQEGSNNLYKRELDLLNEKLVTMDAHWKNEVAKLKTNQPVKLETDETAVVETKKEKVQISQKSLPEGILQKIANLPKKHVQADLWYRIEKGNAHLLLPQSYVFEGESVAMQENGAKVVSELAGILKGLKSTKIEIFGYAGKEAGNTRSLDASFRRAITISKMMNASGIQPENLTVGAKAYSDLDNNKTYPAGVEIIIHPN
ncbi:MAG: OmpA family protein [Bacteroidota bacterium]|nr:OmpA family protein [Bacteroidota bacterium]